MASPTKEFNVLRLQGFQRVKRGVARAFAPVRRTLDPSAVLPVVSLSELTASAPDVSLKSLSFLDGNVSPLELLAIAALVAQEQAKCILEIGTFNGNTTLQMATNAPKDASVYTLDLPFEPVETEKHVDRSDVHYMRSIHRLQRRFYGSDVQPKIHELFGDSATFGIATALHGSKIDFAFIDGSHSWDYVRNDTEKVLPLLAANGVVLWHDYQPYWPGVCHYLNELGNRLTLRRIEGTCLVYYKARTRGNSY